MKYPKPGGKVKHGKTKEEEAHLEWIASLPCSIPGCQNRSNVHHVRSVASKRDHFKTIPLCYDHHQGKEGIHTYGKKSWSEKYGLESEMLKKIEVSH